jgi:hypothetical protein
MAPVAKRSATVFLGLRKPDHVSSSVIPQLQLSDPVHVRSILDAVAAVERFPGRVVGKLPVTDSIWVATSLWPVDIESENHQNHATRFAEIGTYAQVLNDQLRMHSGIVEPAEDSEARTAIIHAHRLAPDENIYVLYIYPGEVRCFHFTSIID